MPSTLDSWIKSTKAADEAAKALASKADNVRPWTVHPDGEDHGETHWIVDMGWRELKSAHDSGMMNKPTADFIAASRTLVPQLLAEKAVLLAMVEKLIEQRDEAICCAFAMGARDVIDRDNRALESLIAEEKT